MASGIPGATNLAVGAQESSFVDADREARSIQRLGHMLVDTVNIPSRLGRSSYCFTVISRVIEVKVQVGDQPTLPYGSEQVARSIC